MSVTRTILCLLLAAACGLPVHTFGVERTFRYGFTVENPTGQVVQDAHLWTYAPIEHTAYQDGQELTASHPYELEMDAFGNRVLHFSFAHLAPYQQVEVRIEVCMNMSNQPQATPGEDALGRARGPLFEVDPGLMAQRVPAFAPVPGMTGAEQIYRWTASYIQYDQYQSQDRGAAYALQHRAGDCTEYMALMAALCRHHQLPVRGIAGYVKSRSGWMNPNQLHNWTEVMLDGQWWVVDPLKRNYLQKGDQYVALYRVGDVDNAMKGFARFRFQGDGLRVRMKKRTS